MSLLSCWFTGWAGTLLPNTPDGVRRRTHLGACIPCTSSRCAGSPVSPNVAAGFFSFAFLIFLRAEKSPERRWACTPWGQLSISSRSSLRRWPSACPLLLAVYWFVMADAESWWRKGLRWLPYAGAGGHLTWGCGLSFSGHLSHAPHLWKMLSARGRRRRWDSWASTPNFSFGPPT